MEKQDKIFIVGVVLVCFVVGFCIGKFVDGYLSLGKMVSNVHETISPGVTLGGQTEVPCFRLRDTDLGGWGYLTVLDGTLTTTSASTAECLKIGK